MATMKRENVLKTNIMDYLDTLGIWNIKMHGSNYIRNAPDLLCCYNGMFIAIEVKNPGEKETAAQAAELAKIRAAGGYAAVVHSMEELKALLAVVRMGMN